MTNLSKIIKEGSGYLRWNGCYCMLFSLESTLSVCIGSTFIGVSYDNRKIGDGAEEKILA